MTVTLYADRAALQHSVTLRVNPAFANNPRWLWESIALYEARQFVDPRGLSFMASGQPPTFDQLSAIEDTRIYDVGHVIAEFSSGDSRSRAGRATAFSPRRRRVNRDPLWSSGACCSVGTAAVALAG